MTLRELSRRAGAIRARYAAAEEAHGMRPWDGEQLMQGFVVDMGQLMRLVMAKAGARSEERLDERIGHELADCLWSVLVLAEAYQVDLERAFWASMDEIEHGLAERLKLAPPPSQPGPGPGESDLSQLGARALEIRRRFASFELAIGGREWGLSQLMEGFAVDVGDLMRLVMAKAGVRQVPDLDKALAHELADCLWCVLVLSEALAVNLEESFLKTMNDIDAKLSGGTRP